MRTERRLNGLIVLLILSVWASGVSAAGTEPGSLKFTISFPRTVHSAPITGRLFLLISQHGEPEVRLQSMWFNSPEIVGKDVTGLEPGRAVVIDGRELGTPLRSLDDLLPGDYYIQAVLNIYTEFHRSDGHTLWAHMDQGEGQYFNKSPGNLYSKVQHIHLDRAGTVPVLLSAVIQPIEPPADTRWVKHIRVQSKLLTRFWGRPIVLGAVVLLPRDYAANPTTHYPVIYYQPEHFRSFPPFAFSTDATPEDAATRNDHESEGIESGYEFYQAWQSDGFPQMVAVSVQTPTPLSDWSGGVDSANNGPYGEAITTELIPAVETQFRIIRQPYARVLTGKDSGGRAALALQVHHADFFGGAWIMHPWPFDYRSWFTVNIYERDNAFVRPPQELEGFGTIAEWLPVERYFVRTPSDIPLATGRQLSQHDAVMAGMAAGDPIGADDVINGPVGADGYPRRLWDRTSGKIDHEVAEYWREHGDLAQFTLRNWSKIGPDLADKLHFYVGGLDEFYRDQGIRLFEASLRQTPNPLHAGTFVYAPDRSSWQPMTNGQLVRIMADYIAAKTPRNDAR
jgi:hypothetical protein